MKIGNYITRARIIDLKSKNFEDAVHELLDICPKNTLPESIEKVHKAIMLRENTMTTCLGSGVAVPHVRLKLKKPYIFFIGRCPEGLEYEGIEEYKKLKFVFLILASENDKSYLNVLASMARIFQDRMLVSRLFHIESIKQLQTSILELLNGISESKKNKNNKFNTLILNEAQKIAKGAQCSFIMIFGDTFTSSAHLPESLKNFKTILVIQSPTDTSKYSSTIDDVIVVRSYSNNRLSQLRSAVLIGITRGIIKYNEKICCVGGITQSNQLDTLVIVDVEREFHTVLTKRKNVLPEGINPEVLERVLGIATELGIEGREGKSIGSLFVIGDIKELSPFIKPLVLNPFYGYKEEDRNILNPFMDETVKEFSSIDGAFVIRGDGVLESAGSLIHAPNFYQQLPSGLGTRHAAAAAISLAAKCIAITVSASSGQITLFKDGQMLPLYDKGI